MDRTTQLLIAFYEGRDPNDLVVQVRAPVDIFAAIEIIKNLQTDIDSRPSTSMTTPITS